MARDAKDGKKGGDASYESKRLEFLVQKNLTDQHRDTAVELPNVQAPSLQDLRVRVRAPREPTPEDIAQRLREIAEVVAETTSRPIGQAVAWGDHVCLNVLGYVGERIIPFSAKERAWMPLAPDPTLPGFFEGIAGKPVGGPPLRVQVDLPNDYSVEWLRGVKASFVVEIVSAMARKVASADDPAFLLSLHKGNTVDAVKQTIAADLRELANSQLQLLVENQVLDELAKRARVEVPEALIDEEIRRRWQAAESPFLTSRGLTREQLESAETGWIQDPATRTDARRRLGISLVLRAIAERDHVEVTPEQVRDLVQSSARAYGEEVANVGEALAGEPQAALQVASVAFHVATLAHVMKQAHVELEPASPPSKSKAR
jgi:trigger factor